MTIYTRRPQLRIIRWRHTAPDRAVCTVCDRVFSLYGDVQPSVEQARDALEREFLSHRCPGPRTTTTALRLCS